MKKVWLVLTAMALFFTSCYFGVGPFSGGIDRGGYHHHHRGYHHERDYRR